MFFDDLLETRVIQLGEFSQVVDVGDDIAQNLFEKQKILVAGQQSSGPVVTGVSRIESGSVHPGNDIVDVLLDRLNATYNLLTLQPLEVEHLIQLAL